VVVDLDTLRTSIPNTYSYPKRRDKATITRRVKGYENGPHHTRNGKMSKYQNVKMTREKSGEVGGSVG
jgi:hypothetical protein